MMPTTIKNVFVTSIILCSFLLHGCAAVIIGAGAAGAGAFAYSEGKLSKIYESEYHETVRVSIETLETLKIPVKDKTTDELQTTIFAERPDGTPVNISVARVSPKSTQVAVRTGKVGVFDKKTSNQIHDFIKHQLGKKTDLSSSDQNLPAPISSDTEAETSESESVTVATPKSKLDPSNHLTIYFDNNTNMLSHKDTELLDRFIEILNQRPTETIVINGYTDALGTSNYNKMLSFSRAGAVKMYLVGKGVAATRFQVIGHGATNFVANNDSKEGRRLNRRVEIYLKQQ